MKKVLFLMFILVVLVISACSKPEPEEPIESYFPTSNSYSITVSSIPTSSPDSIIVKNGSTTRTGTIISKDNQLYFKDINNEIELPVVEEKCEIFLMVLDVQTDIMQSYSKQKSDISILTDGLEVKADVTTIVTTKNGAVTDVEYCEIVEINVYPPINY